MKRKYYKYLIMAALVAVAAFTGCKDDSDTVKGNITLLTPDDGSSFNLSDLLQQNGTITFSWTQVAGMNYSILFSPTEEGLATPIAVLYAKGSASYDLTASAADNLIAQNTDVQPEGTIDLYWTIKSGDGVKSQTRKISFKRLTEKEIEPPALALQDSTNLVISFDASPTDAQSVGVVSNIAWNVTVTPEDASWLAVVPSSGSGNGTITLTAQPNNGDERTATVTLSGQGVDSINISVTQKKFIPVFENNLVYFNDFEKGLGDAVVVGTGSLENAGGNFGTVFQNVGGALRTNYLLLPKDVLSYSADTKALSIGVWVNATNAGASSDYQWSPLFMAYGSAPAADGTNTWPMLGCEYRGVVQVNCNGWCDFTDVQNVKGVNTLYNNDADWLADHQWHYYTATFTPTTAKVYFDGTLVNEWDVDGISDGSVISGLFSNGADLNYICLGGNQAWNWGDPDTGFAFDDIAIYNKELSPQEIQSIIATKTQTVELPTPVYQNTFESGLADCQIIGAGSLVTAPDAGFGQVFQNASGGLRQNYLLLPNDALSHSTETKALSIAVWVNATNAGASSDYQWSPLFMAYGSAPATDGTNTWPMLGCEYRGVVQVNCNGWCDFTDAQNVKGVNTLYNNDADWLADHKWHYYTATFTPTTAKVYFDGVLANEWDVDGTSDGSVISGLFSNGADLNYICLGGNQAWNWGDPDPGFAFDDIAIYNTELSAEQIKALIQQKK